MAHIELDYRATAGLRPSAPFSPTRARQTARTQKPARARPKFCRINAGQLIRSAFLVLLCLGLSYLPRAEKLPAAATVVASKA